MKLSETVNQYVTHKQSVGMRFCTEMRTLKSFCKVMGDIAIAEVEADRVLAFLAGTRQADASSPRGHGIAQTHPLAHRAQELDCPYLPLGAALYTGRTLPHELECIRDACL